MGEDEEGVHFGSTTLKGRKVPLEERGEGREGWKGERGAQRRVANGHRTGDTRELPGLVGSRARQSRSPAPLCFAQKQVVGIIVDSSALRDGPPLDVNQGQGEEKRREGRKGRQERREQGGWRAADGISISWQY